MEAPPLTSTEGAYWYLITLILVLAVVTALYFAGVVLGYLPEPTGLLVIAPPAPF